MSVRKVKRLPKRKQNELDKKRAEAIRFALDNGVTTRKGLAEAAECKVHDLTNLFKKDKKLYQEYQLRKKNIAEIAADNIEEIINDPSHPNNYAASKWILTQYKSELDNTLESREGDEISVEIGGASESVPVVISFNKKEK